MPQKMIQSIYHFHLKEGNTMNKIYKVVWSKAKHTYVVASEIAKGHTKGETTGKGLKKLAAALLVATALLSPSFVWAADTATVTDTESNSQTVYTKDGADNTFVKKGSDNGKSLTIGASDSTNTATHQEVTGAETVYDGKKGTVVTQASGSNASISMKVGNSGNSSYDFNEYSQVTTTKEEGTTFTYHYEDTRSNFDPTATINTTTTIKGDTVTTGSVDASKGVVDGTTEDGTAVQSSKTVGQNLNALDQRITDVKEYVLSETNQNYVSKDDAKLPDEGAIVKTANTIGENVALLDAGLAKETAARIGADKAQDKLIQDINTSLVDTIKSVETVNQNVADGFTALSQTDAAEATAREAADTALDERITNVKEYLEKQTSDNYVSKTDATVKEGAVVKPDKTIGENVTNLDAALAKETAARLGADAAQDKVIQQVNDNLVASVNTINQNMADGFNTLSQVDANELAARVAADTTLVEAVNSGLSLSDDNVLQKNTTTIDENGNVTTSKTAATEMILNQGNDNQITMNENGIKVGTNSTVVDKDGVYTGGDTYDAAYAALKSDGSIKGANGAFTVDTNGNVTSTETVKGATLTDGTATISNGNIKTNGGYIQTGGGNVNTQGGEVRTNGGKVATSGGEINTGSGDIKTVGGNILTAGGKLNTSGGDIVAGTGNISGQNITASGVLSGDSLTVAKGMTGQSLTLTGGDLDAGAGTIKTTGAVETGTLKTTGRAEIGGDLDVKGNLSVEGEFNAKTLSSKLDENNFTTINGGNVTSVNSKVNTDDGRTYTSSSKLTEKGRTDTAADGTTLNKSTQTASESSSTISSLSDTTQKSYITQNLKKILQGIENGDNASTISQTETGIKSTATDGTKTASTNLSNEGFNTYATDGTNKTYTLQTAESITSQIGDDGKVKSVMNAEGITNTADGGTITNSAKDLVNTATGDMTNTVGGKLLNDVTGDMENKVGGDQTTTVTGDSSLTAENINNEAKKKITNKALDVETDASSSIVNKVVNAEGSNTSTQLSYQTMEEMSQAEGKTASYLRGAAEEKSQLIDGDTKTTIDTVAGETNTNITDGTSISNSLQKADQMASSVKNGDKQTVSNQDAESLASSATNGTNTTVVNQDAKSLASSITDGTKYNNTSSTVDKSEQLIQASDTQYSDSSKTATKMEDTLVSGSSIIDVIKNLDDAANPAITSTVTDGTNTTSVAQTAEDITNTAKNGTITNDAKDLVNTASENMTTTVGGEMKTTVTGKVTEDFKSDLSTTIGGNKSETVTGTSTETVTGKKTENYNGGLETTVTGEEKHTVNGNQTNTITGTQTTTVTGDVTEDYKANLSTTVGGNQTTTVTGDSSLSAKNITNKATEKLSNSAADIENTASTSITDKVGENTSWKMTNGKISESIVNGTASNKENTTVEGTKRIITSADGTGTYNQTASSNDISLKNAVGDTSFTKSESLDGEKTSVTNTKGSSTINQSADSIVNFVKDSDGNTTRTEQSATDITNTAKEGTITNDAKDITNTASEKITSQIGNGSAVKSEMTADGITNTATKITNITGDNTVTSDTNGTTFENTNKKDTVTFMGEEKSVDTTNTTISGNTITTGEAVMDYADVLKDLGVRGNATIKGDTTMEGNASVGKDLTVVGKSTLTGDVTMESNATVKKNLTVEGETSLKNTAVDGTLDVTGKSTLKGGLDVTGGTTTDTLKVTSTSEFDSAATFNDIVTMNKGLSVTGGVTADTVTAASYKVGDKTYIDENGINANNQVIRNVGQGNISEGSTDAVTGGQLYETNTRVTGLENRMDTVENRVDKLDGRIDKVGANAAAMANLHPLEFDADSKWNIAAAVGNYGNETATAIGAFYRPSENVMVNASTSMGTGENMYGGGVSVRLGQGGNKKKSADVKAAIAENKELRAKVDDLTARMDALLSVLNPNMSKDFPDVPENHWAYEAVSRLAGNGIVEGYEDGKYHGERQMTRYEMAEIIYNALSKGAKAEKKLVEEFRPELQAMAAQKKA